MTAVSQLMRIATGLDDAVRPGAQKLAAAVDQLPFIASSPESMYVAHHPRVAVQAALNNALAGLRELQDVPAFQRANSYDRVEGGVRQLARVLEHASDGPIARDLVRGPIRAFDDTVRNLASPGSY